MKKVDVITPQAMQYPIAYNGTKNTIPVSATGTNLASEEEGFPLITEKPVNQGGLPPQRSDFNGLFYTSTDQKVFLQNGGIITFNDTVSTTIGGYPEDAILDYLSNNQILKVQSLIDNNTYNFVSNNSYIDGEKWKILYSYKNQDTISKWDEDTIFNAGDIAFLIVNNEPILYYSKTANNIGNNPTTDSTNWAKYSDIFYDDYTKIDGSNAAFSNLSTTGKENILSSVLGNLQTEDETKVGYIKFFSQNTFTSITLPQGGTYWCSFFSTGGIDGIEFRTSLTFQGFFAGGTTFNSNQGPLIIIGWYLKIQ